MKNKYLLLSFDIEEFDLPQEYGAEISENDKFAISAAGCSAVMDIMERTGIKATFFITGKFAAAYPEMIKAMAQHGHEIASHGMDHSEFFPAHLTESKMLLEKISGSSVTGFRMARLAPVAKEDIADAGYVYESSLNPVWLPGRYCNIGKPLLPFQEKCGLWQLPVSALPGIRLPLFWLSFKNLPLSIYTRLAAAAVKLTGYYNMYSHPWEYCSDAANAQWNIPGYVTKHAGSAMCGRLEKLINKLRNCGEFVTFQQYMRENGL